MEIRPDTAHVNSSRRTGNDPPRPKASPNAVQGEVKFNVLQSFTFSLFRFGLLASGIVAIGMATGAFMWLNGGVAPVRDAARRMASAEDAWFATLNQTQPVLHELTALGGASQELETVYFAFYDAKLAHKAENADVLLQVMQDQTLAVRALGHDTERIVDMLKPATIARGEATTAYHAWLESMKAPASQLAVAFGLAPSPTPRLERYSRPPRAMGTMVD